MSQARDSARALLSALPEQVDIMLTLANIELSLGNLEAAEAQLIKAGIVAPDDEALRADLARSLETLARHFEQRGEPDRAALSRSRANRKPAKKTLPTASVVVLCYNQLSLTKECIDSVLAHTSTAYELIVVDNASSDDTASYLEGLAEAHEHVRVILNHDNLGFAGGNNCGMAIAEGDVVVLLNNDTVVTDGWLSGMLETFVRHPEAMLVGPRSNYVTGPQLVERVDYRDVETLAGFGAAWKNAHRGKDEEVSRVIGFCMAIRRPLLEQIGGLDEGFGRGNFEDDDYCLRCRAHGHRVFISHEVFIHHEGGQSFKAAGIDYQNLLLTNWNFFKRKWGLPAEANIQTGYAADLKPPATALAPVALPPIDSTYSSNASGRILRQSRSASTDTSSASDPARPASDGTSIDDRGTAFDNAEAAAANGDWPLATTLFSDMTKQYPSFAPGFVGLASSLFASGHVEEGGNALEAACDLEPENLALRVQLGVTMAHAGILQRAEKAFVKVLSIDPDHLDALLSLAQLCRASDHLPEAVQLVSHAHQVHPTEPDVIAAVAELALQLGDEEAAKMTLAELRRLDPEHPLLQT